MRFFNELNCETPMYKFIGYSDEPSKFGTTFVFKCKSCQKRIESFVRFDEPKIVKCGCTNKFEVIIPLGYDMRSKKVVSFDLISEYQYKKVKKLKYNGDSLLHDLIALIKEKPETGLMKPIKDDDGFKLV